MVLEYVEVYRQEGNELVRVYQGVAFGRRDALGQISAMSAGAHENGQILRPDPNGVSWDIVSLDDGLVWGRVLIVPFSPRDEV